MGGSEIPPVTYVEVRPGQEASPRPGPNADSPGCLESNQMTTPSFEAKICDPAAFARRVMQVARPLVFTNGVFDILHRGHVTYLAEARALGASLVVALNSDASVKRLGKGDDRPINTLADRVAVVAALESVALVTW